MSPPHPVYQNFYPSATFLTLYPPQSPHGPTTPTKLHPPPFAPTPPQNFSELLWRLPCLPWLGMANHRPPMLGPTHGGFPTPLPAANPLPPPVFSFYPPSSPATAALFPLFLAAPLPPPLLPHLPHPTPRCCPSIHLVFHPLSAIHPFFPPPPLLHPTSCCCPSDHRLCHPLLVILPPFLSVVDHGHLACLLLLSIPCGG